MPGPEMESDDRLRKLLIDARTIAVVGIKDRENEDAFRIPQYLQDAGYAILPINPKVERVLGEKCFPNFDALPKSDSEPISGAEIDIVNLFRASEHVAGHVEEILRLDPAPKAVWMQLGIHHGESAGRLREAGIHVIQDRCIMVDHRRLIGAGVAPDTVDADTHSYTESNAESNADSVVESNPEIDAA